MVIEDFDLVIIFEFKWFYNGFFDGYYDCFVVLWKKYVLGDVDDGYYIMLLGKVVIMWVGIDLMILVYGMMVYVVLVVVVEMGIDVEVIDLRILVFLDIEIIKVFV